MDPTPAARYLISSPTISLPISRVFLCFFFMFFWARQLLFLIPFSGFLEKLRFPNFMFSVFVFLVVWLLRKLDF
uniref:Uncharacterized protein n=1 Tax=Rhizophora mucronata TaxID=61149 RepID=A0A2P2QB60_RHIMU